MREGGKVKKQKGFSLIELLIVVAIILVIAAIAIPNLMKSKMAANESSTVSSIRTIVTSELSYAEVNPTSGYQSLGALASAGLIDTTLGAGTKSGYNFNLTPGSGTPPTTFTTWADPSSPGNSGTNYYCSDQSGVIQRGSSTFSGGCTGGTPIGNGN